jgi:hypothetical protein
MISFVCSVGNVPLAAVLFRGGISFAGVIAFIFADLIIIPILNIYRKYYTGRVSAYLFAVSYATMVLAGLAIGGLFTVLHLTPTNRAITVFQTTILVELRYVPRHRVPAPHRALGDSLPAHRRHRDAAHDGTETGRGAEGRIAIAEQPDGIAYLRGAAYLRAPPTCVRRLPACAAYLRAPPTCVRRLPYGRGGRAAQPDHPRALHSETRRRRAGGSGETGNELDRQVKVDRALGPNSAHIIDVDPGRRRRSVRYVE